MTKIETAAIAQTLTDKNNEIAQLKAKLNQMENGNSKNGAVAEDDRLPILKASDLPLGQTFEMEITGRFFPLTQYGYKYAVPVTIGNAKRLLTLNQTNRGVIILLEGLRQGKYRYQLEHAQFEGDKGMVDYLKINKYL